MQDDVLDRLTAVTDPDERLLFRALRGEREALAQADPRAWRGLTEAALRTFSAPLLHATLGRDGLANAPEEVAVRLGRSRAWSRARWELAQVQMRRLGEGFGAAGLPCMLLKGGHLARLHPAPGARATGDVDLLVARHHLDAAQRVLRDLGYTQRGEEPWAWPHPHPHHLPSFHIADGLPVDLHWSLDGPEVDPPWAPEVWARAIPLPDAGGALGMEPLDALLYTCQHLGEHHTFITTNGIAGLADLAVLLDAHTFDPAQVRDRAEAWGLRPAVALCLLLARDLVGAKVPGPLLAAVALPQLTEVAPSAVWLMLHVGGPGATRHLQLPSQPTLNPPPPIAGIRGKWPLRAAWTFMRAAAFPPVDDVRLEQPRLPAPLNYPLLWSRLGWRHAGLLRLADPRARAAARARSEGHRQTVRAFVRVPPP